METLPWIAVLLAVSRWPRVAAARASGWSCGRARSQPPLPTEWALTARPVFSTDERRVYRLLREALPHHVVLSKLPLVRFCQPSDPSEVRYWYDLLGAINVTFAVCSANGRVLAAIDLDTDRGNSRRILQIKQSVLGACRVRYLRCPVDNLPIGRRAAAARAERHGATARGPQPASCRRATSTKRATRSPARSPARRAAAHRALAGLVASSRIRSSRPTAAPTAWATASSRRSRHAYRAPSRGARATAHDRRDGRLAQPARSLDRPRDEIDEPAGVVVDEPARRSGRARVTRRRAPARAGRPMRRRCPPTPPPAPAPYADLDARRGARRARRASACAATAG